MIERILIKQNLSFENVELNFGRGLSVFTGVSGAGKSVLMGSIMAVLGLKDSEAKLIEADVSHKFDLEEFGLESEEINIFKLFRDKTTRYFINSQAVSKKNLASIAKEHVKYLSAKEINEFENERFLNLLDSLQAKKDAKFNETLGEFRLKFDEFSQISRELKKIIDEEKRVEELKEFASFEINKIESVSPKIGEFDELMELKKRLSKKDKILEAWNRAEQIFNFEQAVTDALNISDIDSGFFEEAMNELRVARENLNMDELEDVDVGGVLDRIEAINSLVRRYGGEEEALQTLKARKAELARYENISFEKSELERKFKQNEAAVNALAKKDAKFNETLGEFRLKFDEFSQISRELKKIIDEEKRVEELKEFASFEINKIESVSPKIGEFDELMELKKRLSKKDKILEAWNRAEQIFNFEQAVTDALNISDIDSGFFEEAMNELRVARENLNMDELEDVDVGGVLDRIEAINSLVRRYGGEEEALQTLKARKAELARYENISFEKSELERKFKQNEAAVNALADKISQARAANLKELEALINSFLKELYMSEISLKINSKTLDAAGGDEVNLSLNETALKNLSSGELNRLRLAFIASESKITGGGEGVIILDEIDANLSGKEAMSIANVLLNLAEFYQIFAISHQPQLSSKANAHFLVEKRGEISNVRELKSEERVSELARMISGERITDEAINFARQLLVV